MTAENRDTRIRILKMISQGKAAHVASAFSAVEILNALFKSVDVAKVKSHSDDRDRIVMSKGHATASLYATMRLHGLLTDEEIATYAKDGSLLQSHASHGVRGVEHSTGSLGHGASAALGMAIGARSKKNGGRAFVVTGDGELQEGSNWEAFMLAGHLQLSNYCVLVDNNGMSQMGKFEGWCDVQPLAEKFKSFRFRAVEVDGHDEAAIRAAIATLGTGKGPLAIICKTTKGKGVSFMEGNTLWHYVPPTGKEYDDALSELQNIKVQ
jgi:transketolase